MFSWTIFFSSSSLCCDLHLQMDMRNDKVNELSSLLGSLERVRLVEKVDDIRVWDMDSSCVFSVKFFYESFFLISSFRLFFFSFTLFGKVSIPPKVQVFSWTTMLGKLPISEMMQKKWHLCAMCPNWCLLCRNEKENQDHLFIHCSFMTYLWLLQLSLV